MHALHPLLTSSIYNGRSVLYKGLLYSLEMLNWLFSNDGEFLSMYKKLVPLDESPVVVFGNLYMMNLSELRKKLNKKSMFHTF